MPPIPMPSDSLETSLEMIEMAAGKTDLTALRNSTISSAYHRTLSAAAMIGQNVRNREGDTLGTLKDIMIDMQSGQIAYGVLESGSFLDMDGRLFAIPFGAFTVAENGHIPIINVDTETLRNAEGFDQHTWPDFSNQEWNQKTHSYYGYLPYY
jgi:sporulation protein YlmC with PRC-barrel domain